MEVKYMTTPYGRQSYEHQKVKVDTIWGTMEHDDSGAKCYLYRANCRRQQAEVEMRHAIQQPQWNIFKCFSLAWTGPYSLRSNNCIDYALKCWNLLCGTNFEYENVV